MSSASSHSEVISRKPSDSCLIHPSISSSSSDYDQGEEFDLLSESLKEPKPEDLLRKIYYTFEDGPVYFVYPFDIVTLKPSLEIEPLQVQEQIRPQSLFKRILAFFFTKPNPSSSMAASRLSSTTSNPSIYSQPQVFSAPPLDQAIAANIFIQLFRRNYPPFTSIWVSNDKHPAIVQ